MMKLLITLLMLTVSSAFADELLQLSLKSEVMMLTPQLTLADVVDASRTSEDLISQYGTLSLKNAGVDNKITPSSVLLVLSAAGADLSRISLISGAERSVVATENIGLLERIKKQLKADLAQYHHCPIETIELSLTQVPEKLPDSGSFTEIKTVIAPPNYHVNFVNGSDRVVKSLELGVDVKFRLPVLVAKQDLVVGDWIDADDFVLESRLVDNFKNIFRTDKALQNDKRWQLARNLSAGDILSHDVIKSGITLKKGDLVTIITQNNSFQVRALGKVKDLVDNGASVLVENVDSKKQVLARPMNNNEVEVVF